MRRERLIESGYYHLYNRGENGEKIFYRQKNWLFFLSNLKRYFVPEQADILVYCLMPNHYHLLIRINCENFSNTVMKPFGISYTKAINKQQERNGHVFQGPFQSRQVQSDADLLNLSRYIHNNPVAAGLVKKPVDWEFSSFRDYIGLRNGNIPKRDLILGIIGNVKKYQDFVEGEAVGSMPENLLFD